jgi:hypothetical protein
MLTTERSPSVTSIVQPTCRMALPCDRLPAAAIRQLLKPDADDLSRLSREHVVEPLLGDNRADVGCERERG